MKYILGVDLGGSKTQAAIATLEGKILHSLQVCGTIHTAVGIAGVMKVLRLAIERCLTDTGTRMEDIGIGVFGMTGVDWPFEKELHAKALKRQFPAIGEIIVCNDSIIAFHAGAAQPWGAILCSGTGYNVAAIAPSGESLVFGYYVDAPHCGGKSLGRMIIKAVCNAQVGLCEKTILTEAVLDHFKANDTDELLMSFLDGQYTTEALLQLPAILFAYYDQHDQVSITLVENMYREHAAHAVAAFKKLRMQDTNPEVVLSGGMLKAAPADIIESVSAYINLEIPNAKVSFSLYEPILGALKIGMLRLEASTVDISALYASAQRDERMLRKR